MADKLRTVEEDMKKYEPLISSDQERAVYNDFRTDWNNYISIHNQTMELARVNKIDAARSLSTTQGRDALNGALEKLGEDAELNRKGGDESAKSAATEYVSARYWAVGLLLAAVAIGAFVAIALARSIT